MYPSLDSALHYAALGYPVFPCHADKKPATTHGHNDAVTDPEQIRKWWGQNPAHNVGLSAADVLVVDLDGEDHPWLQYSWPAGTPTSRTPRGGWHFYFRRPLGKQWKCSAGLLAPAVDIRTSGGYLVEFPSTTEHGAYRWVEALRPHELLPAPPLWLVSVLDHHYPPAPPVDAPPGYTPKPESRADETRPGDDFNNRGSWADTGLFEAGWTWHNQPGAEVGFLTRPGKSHDTSATLGICTSKLNGWPLFYNFTGNAPPLPSNAPLSRFAVYAILKHGGDFPTAARALVALGYGNQRSSGPNATWGGGTNSSPGNTGTAAPGAAEPTGRPGPRPQFRSAGELMRDCPALRPPILHGLLREGETLNIIAPPKTGKSWLVLDAALSVATGQPWLGREVVGGEVLIIDNELHGETMANRIPKVAEARGIPIAEYRDRLHVDNLRGSLTPLAGMESYFGALEPNRFKLIILDAWYRFQAPGTDENSNADATEMYNLLDRFAARLNCAFVCIHHSTKGNQSGKSITDVGAGAGAQSRAADAHMIIRQHAEEGCFVIEAVARSWAPPEPVCVRWNWPVFRIEHGLDAASLLGAKGAGASGGGDKPTKSEKFRTDRSNETAAILKGIEELRTQEDPEPGATKNDLRKWIDQAKVNAAVDRLTEDGTLEEFTYFKKSAGREVDAYRRKAPVEQPTVFDPPEANPGGCEGPKKSDSFTPSDPSAGLSDGGAVGGCEECAPPKGGTSHLHTPPRAPSFRSRPAEDNFEEDPEEEI